MENGDIPKPISFIFNCFDKEKSGRVDYPHFKEILKLIGYTVDGIGEDFTRIIAICDPEKKGYVTLTAYYHFFLRERGEEPSTTSQ